MKEMGEGNVRTAMISAGAALYRLYRTVLEAPETCE
jgi:hypothetical protein